MLKCGQKVTVIKSLIIMVVELLVIILSRDGGER